MTTLQSWIDFLNDAQALNTWHRDHAEIPIVAVSLYLVFIFGVPNLMKNRKEFDLKFLFTVWNLALAVFSFLGSYHLVPYLYNVLMTKGWKYSICENSDNWYNSPPYGIWVALFIYSKFPELIDTAFLVLRKKPVIFLHWFHHVTVLLYCWHSYHHAVAAGLWFATMNFAVHTIMYSYYFMMNAGFYSLMRPIAPIITTLQLLQMIGGIVVLVSVASAIENGEKCSVDHANYKLGLMMYFSYFILFAILFWDKYIAKKPASSRRSESSLGCVDEASNVDASGLFRPEEDGDKKLKTK